MIRLATANWVFTLSTFLDFDDVFVVFVFDVFFGETLWRIEFFVFTFPLIILLVIESETKVFEVLVISDETIETKSGLEGALLQRSSKRNINRLGSDVLLIDCIKSLLRGRLDDQLIRRSVRRKFNSD